MSCFVFSGCFIVVFQHVIILRVTFFLFLDGLRRILCNTVLAPKEDSDLLGRVLLADSTLWKGSVTLFFIPASIRGEWCYNILFEFNFEFILFEFILFETFFLSSIKRSDHLASAPCPVGISSEKKLL